MDTAAVETTAADQMLLDATVLHSREGGRHNIGRPPAIQAHRPSGKCCARCSMGLTWASFVRLLGIGQAHLLHFAAQICWSWSARFAQLVLVAGMRAQLGQVVEIVMPASERTDGRQAGKTRGEQGE